MKKIVLCDDEKRVTDQLSDYISSFYQRQNTEYTITVCSSGRELDELISKRTDMDALFLDIDLKDSHGIALARKLRITDKKVRIIFISNYKNYKSAAFSVRAFGYIDKPATREQIYRQLNDLEAYQHAAGDDPVLKFETTAGWMNLPVRDILYFESAVRKVFIHTFADTYPMHHKISRLAVEMAPYHFERPHSSFLVNLDYVIGIKNYTVYMAGQTEIPLSQRRSAAFHLAVDQFLARTIHICKGAN